MAVDVQEANCQKKIALTPLKEKKERKNQKSTDTPNLPHQTRLSASLITAGKQIEKIMGSHTATLTNANMARL